MNKTRWVQHISGQGEKWEVDRFVHGVSWRVCRDGSTFYLPWKEYVDCDPPEQWEDVSGECYVTFTTLLTNKVASIGHNKRHLSDEDGYRLRKVRCAKSMGVDNPDWAFIVERKKS